MRRSKMAALVVGGLFVYACGPLPSEDGSLPSGPIASASQNREVLPLGLRMRAIEARARLARQGRAPSENVRRVFDKFGNVVREEIETADGFVERRSTLPASLTEVPLRTFLADQGVGRAAASGALRLNPVVKTHTYTASINSQNVTVADTASEYATSAYVGATRDASDSNFSFVSDVWFADSGDMGSVTQSTGADLIGIEDGSVVHYEFFGSEYALAMEELDSLLTAASGSLATANIGAASESTRTRLTKPLPQGPILFGGDAFLTDANCEEEEKSVKRKFAIYTGAVIVATGACLFTGPFGCGGAILVADAAALNFYFGVAEYVLCLLNILS